MPHASLLGSNGHHSTFTSEMIPGQINVFIVLQKREKTHIHSHTPAETPGRSDTCTSTFSHTHTRAECKAQVVHTHAHTLSSVCRTQLSVAQLKDQRHLEVKRTHCPGPWPRSGVTSPFFFLFFFSFLGGEGVGGSIEKCFLQHDLLHHMIVSFKPFIEQEKKKRAATSVTRWIMSRA